MVRNTNQIVDNEYIMTGCRLKIYCSCAKCNFKLTYFSQGDKIRFYDLHMS